MTFFEVLTKLRRFLRDPDGDIWTDDDLVRYWNASQQEIAIKIGYIEYVHAYRYPPIFEMSYMWDWEYQYAGEGDIYRCLMCLDQRETVITHPWEAGFWMTSMDTPDDGDRITHLWEVAYCDYADRVEIPLHRRFVKGRFVAWDESEVIPKEWREIAKNNPDYRTVSGNPVYYYLPDEEHNTIVLYPRPSTITWSEDDRRIDESEGLEDDGGITSYVEDVFDTSDTGLTIETIDTAGQLFMVFTGIPEDIDISGYEGYTTPIDLPKFILKAIECATLEHAFGANTDGFIPSLRDYWKQRKEISLQAIKEFQLRRYQDRDYRLGGYERKPKSRLRLPEGYPATWP